MTVCANPLSIATMFNEFYVSVVQQLITNRSDPRLLQHQHTSHPLQYSMFLTSITHFEIGSVVSNLKNKKSTIFGRRSTQLIKFIPSAIFEALTFIDNLIILSGEFPSKLNQGVIFFLTRDRLCIQIYRLISLLSVLYKLLDR